MVEFPRETVEYGFVTVKNGAAVITAGVELVVVPYVEAGVTPRPIDWKPAIVVEGKTAFIVRDLPPGRYAVWARFTAGTETPVRLVGEFRIT